MMKVGKKTTFCIGMWVRNMLMSVCLYQDFIGGGKRGVFTSLELSNFLNLVIMLQLINYLHMGIEQFDNFGDQRELAVEQKQFR